MNHALETALAKILRLPDEQQALAAELLEHVAASTETYDLSDEERAIVRDALKRARRGAFATEDQADAAIRRPWA